MKNIILILALSFSSNFAFAAADCSGTSVPNLAKFAQLELNIYVANIDGIYNLAEMDASKVDLTERDLAICNFIGEARNNFMVAYKSMRALQNKLQLRCAPGDPVQLEASFEEILKVELNLKHFCYRAFGDDYRDIDALKTRLAASKKAIKDYTDLLSTYQKP